LESWWQIPYYWIGGKVYDFVAGADRHVPPSSYIGKEQALYAFPMLNPAKLKGAIVYYDGQMNDTRYALSIILTAIQAGAACANYVRVEKLLASSPQLGKEGEILAQPVVKGAVVRDLQSNKQFEIHAKSVINCTGPFSDHIRKMAHEAVAEKLVGPADKSAEAQAKLERTQKFDELIIPAGGVHVVLPDHFSPEQMGLIVPETSDGRVLFFLPWEGGTLCGTTDSKSDLTMLPRPTLEEIDFILSESSRYLNRPIHRSDVRAAWSGIRPLVKDLHKSSSGTASLSREHVVEVNPGNMVTVAGGKWTTYRRMAQDALDKMLELNPKMKSRAAACSTEGAMLIGADRAKIVCDQRFDIIQVTLREQYGFDRDVAAHLTRAYGTRSLQIAEMIIGGYYNRAPGLHPKRLVAKHPVLEAEVVFAVEQEYACSAVDFLGRRTRLAYLDHDAAAEALPHVVDIMGTLLKWDKTKKQAEMKRAKEFLETFRVPDEVKSDGKE
jgi:glycerol-3-phosphate dehydrogenase